MAQRTPETLTLVRHRAPPTAVAVARLAGTAVFAYLVALPRAGHPAPGTGSADRAARGISQPVPDAAQRGATGGGRGGRGAARGGIVGIGRLHLAEPRDHHRGGAVHRLRAAPGRCHPRGPHQRARPGPAAVAAGRRCRRGLCRTMADLLDQMVAGMRHASVVRMFARPGRQHPAGRGQQPAGGSRGPRPAGRRAGGAPPWPSGSTAGLPPPRDRPRRNISGPSRSATWPRPRISRTGSACCPEPTRRPGRSAGRCGVSCSTSRPAPRRAAGGRPDHLAATAAVPLLAAAAPGWPPATPLADPPAATGLIPADGRPPDAD
jgi:hypothetical protein